MLHSKKLYRMNKLPFISTFFVMFVLITVCVIPESGYAQFDFNAFLGSQIVDENIDGLIGSEWNDASNYVDIAIEPYETAEVWTKNDETYLYLAMQFTADSINPWVAIQFDIPSHMSSGADGAIFGHDRLGANEYRDISFGGVGSITVDSTQNGIGVINVGNSNKVTIELKKPLASGDSAGADIDWTIGSIYTLIFRWDSNGGGSSGGDSSHQSGPARNRTIFINTDEITEFSGLALFVASIITSIIVVLLKKSLKNNIDRKIKC